MVGGVPELARRLNVAERQLDYWMREIGTPPDTMFFDVMDIIIENAGERVTGNDLPRGPVKPAIAPMLVLEPCLE
jgi:hypothetical protein